jgi:hypothetical protein
MGRELSRVVTSQASRLGGGPHTKRLLNSPRKIGTIERTNSLTVPEICLVFTSREFMVAVTVAHSEETI